MMYLESKNKSGLIFLIIYSFTSAMGGLLFGYDMFVISGAKDLIVNHFHLSTLMEGWFVSSAMVGAMIGCLVAGILSDRYGRKKALIISSAFLLMCSIGCGLAWSTASLIFFRWIGGVGVGIASMVCPLYISEISPARIRGRMVTLFQLAICVGIVMAIMINTGLFKWHDSIQHTNVGGFLGIFIVKDVWRSMLGMEALPSALFFLFSWFIAESPRWLVEKGRDKDAIMVLERINGVEVAKAEMSQITTTIKAETGSFKDLFKSGLRLVLFMALFLAIVSEFSGITTIWNFGPEIIRGQSIQLASEMTGMVIIAASLSVFTLLAVWLMDLAGRRMLLFWGTLGCFIALVALGFLLGNDNYSSTLKIIVIALYVACFAFSLGPIKWVFISEVFPTRIRARAASVSTMAVWASDAVLNQLFPILRDNFGKSMTFFFFAIILIPQFFFIWKMMPETKGKSLEEIEGLLHSEFVSKNSANKEKR